MRRARALFVTPVRPSGSGNGLAMRADLLLTGLALDHDVEVVVVPVFGASDAGAGAGTATVAPLTSPGATMVERLATERGRARAARIAPYPATSACVGPSLAELVRARSVGADVVVVMRLYLAPVLDQLLGPDRRPRLVLDLDDLDWEREVALGRPDEGAAYRRLARAYLPEVDLALVTKAGDVEPARAVGATSVAVVPNGVRVPAALAAADPAHDLLLVGTLAYEPNAEGARWLCDEVLPHLPGVTLAIVGANPSSAVRQLAARAGVSVHADVPDVAPWYAAARVVVAPVLAGAGTRIKILEAWAHRRPVVSTSVAADGIDADGGGWLIADDPAGFARACRRLLDDERLAAGLVDAGRRHLRLAGTLDRAAATLAKALASVRPVVGPRRAEGLEVNEVADGFVVYDPARDRVHYLNHTATLVLELCTGEHAEPDIVRLLGEAYDLPERPEIEIAECLEVLRAEGLIH